MDIVVGKVVARLGLPPIIKKLKSSVEHDMVVTTQNNPLDTSGSVHFTRWNLYSYYNLVGETSDMETNP